MVRNPYSSGQKFDDSNVDFGTTCYQNFAEGFPADAVANLRALLAPLMSPFSTNRVSRRNHRHLRLAQVPHPPKLSQRRLCVRSAAPHLATLAWETHNWWQMTLATKSSARPRFLLQRRQSKIPANLTARMSATPYRQVFLNAAGTT